MPTSSASWTIDLQGVARGEMDFDLGIWMAAQKSTVQPLTDAGKSKLLVKNVPDAQYDVVVPDYVWDAGVHCICDLADHADKFDRTIYGIEAGNDGNEIMKGAIENNTYYLGDWQAAAVQRRGDAGPGRTQNRRPEVGRVSWLEAALDERRIRPSLDTMRVGIVKFNRLPGNPEAIRVARRLV